MMNCQGVSNLLDQWQAGEPIQASAFSDLRAHLQVCPVCAQRVGPLVPLLRFDVLQEIVQLSETKDFSIADQVMGGILQNTERATGAPGPTVPEGDRGKPLTRRSLLRRLLFRSPLPRRTFPRPGRIGALGAAIAAVLVLALGLSRLMVPPTAADRVVVTFVLEAPQAQSVAVTGNFDNWSAQGIPLKKQGDGKTWKATVTLKRSLEYRYNFVIDGERYISDPRAVLSVDDGFGGQVSLLDL